MDQNEELAGRSRGPRATVPSGFRALVDALLAETRRDESRTGILRRICKSLLRFSATDALSLVIDTEGAATLCRARAAGDGQSPEAAEVEVVSLDPRAQAAADDLVPAPVMQAILAGNVAAPAESCTRAGSYWTGDTARPMLLWDPVEGGAPGRTVIVGGAFPSLAVLRVPIGPRSRGVLTLASRRRDFFTADDVLTYETVAQMLGVALAHQGAQWALRERVKELTCLYGIARIANRSELDIDQCLAEIVALLPPAWQFPQVTEGRIVVDGRAIMTPGFRDVADRLDAVIRVDGKIRGAVEVVYVARTPGMEQEPFLEEERSLIAEIARQVGLVLEHRESEAETQRLQEQLRHAERLATIGQLSAGVAHELNEPLAAILGFAELAKAVPGLPAAAAADTNRIIKAALHAREIIRKLLIFTRQMPTSKAVTDLNKIVSDGLYFLETRCRTQGISLVRRLDPEPTLVMADPAQLHQALVNLVVNAVQAMPEGGVLTVSTRVEADRVLLAVEDTGEGMTPEVQRRLFTPFFTTKDVGQGTGLGLAVVHGIVTAHGGAVDARSAVGEGSTFEITLPLVRAAPSAEAQ